MCVCRYGVPHIHSSTLGLPYLLLVQSLFELFNRLEQLGKVTFAEATAAGSLLLLLAVLIYVAADALDDLTKDGGAVAWRVCGCG